MPAVGDSTVPAANPQEQADRDAIEAVWRQAWELIDVITDVPAVERPVRVYSLFADPIAARILDSAARADSAGATFFGHAVLHPYWYRAVDGKDFAVIGDCQDASASGSMDRATGEVLSVGKVNANTVGSLVRDPMTGGWRVFEIATVTGTPCTAPAP